MIKIPVKIDWITMARGLSYERFGEYMEKVLLYGFSECRREVKSSDPVVQMLLDATLPEVEREVKEYIEPIQCDD